jgi:DNA-binding MarR family transcriptional regulator
MPASLQSWTLPPTPRDVDEERARRKENIRAVLKLFRVTLDAVRRHAEWTESRYGIGAAPLWALWELAQTPGQRAADLARAMAVHRATAEELLRELLARGLVERGDVEGGAATHRLTAAGRRIAEDAGDNGQGVLKAALEHLPEAGLAALLDALRPMTERLPLRESAAAMHPVAHLLRPMRDGEC